MGVRQRRIIQFLLILLAFSLQFEVNVVRIDRIWSIGFPTVLALIALLNRKSGRLSVPKIVIGLILLLFWATVIAFVWTPFWIGSPVRIQRIAYELVYLISLILFFYTSYLTEKNALGDFFFRWMARFTAVVASLSLLTEVFGLYTIRPYLYLVGNSRFGGFLQNPNDFGIMGFLSLAYWVNTDEEPVYLRIPAILALLFSFIAGRSKGPIVILVLYLIVFIWISLSRKRTFFAKKNALYALGGIAFSGLSIVFLFLLFREEIISIPGFAQNRILNMLVSPKASLNGNGSDRLIAWNGALIQIMKSPILGVGIGGGKSILTYLQYPYPHVTPHNMYLELLAQFGLLLGTGLILSLFRFIVGLSKSRDSKTLLLWQAAVLLLFNGFFFGVSWYSVSWILFGILYCKAKRYRVVGAVQNAIGVSID